MNNKHKAKKTGTENQSSGVATMPFRATNLVEEMIPAYRFVRYPTNRQPKQENVEKMKESLLLNGQLQPIQARPLPDLVDGVEVYEIVFGETRWLGCKAIAENQEVRCYIIPMDDKEASRIHAIENFQRTELDEIDQARTIQNMKENGWDIEEISKEVGLAQAMIYRRLTLLRLSPTAIEQFREGNLGADTAQYIVNLPEEEQEKALQAVTQPTYSNKALPVKEAIELIKRDFIQPAEMRQKWESRKHELLSVYSGCKWLEYDEAKKMNGWNSGYALCEEQPVFGYLSEAARAGELVVPTWAVLADKHGAEKVIAFDGYNKDEFLHKTFVQHEPLIAAEIAAFEDKPGECIFMHPGAVQQAKLDAERRKKAEEAKVQTVSEELGTAISMILAGKLSKTAEKKYAEDIAVECLSDRFEILWLPHVFVIPEDFDGERCDFAEKKIREFMRNKELGGFELLGRIVAAMATDQPSGWSLSSYGDVADLMFKRGVFKNKDFPVLSSCIMASDPDEDEDDDDGQALESAE